MEVRWAPRAVKDLDHIFRRIEQDNPKAAHEVIQTIYEAVYPWRNFLNGAPWTDARPPRLVFPGLPYLAVYKLSDHGVEISRFWHGAQDWK
jgi:plasmid stabilization system protein ParE